MIKKIIIIFSAFLVIALIVLAIIFLLPKPVIPSNITKQVNFVIFYPTQNQTTTIQKQTIKYDSSMKQLSFVVRFDKQNITFAEQSSPDSFTDDPNFYPQFIKSLNGYVTFSSVDGTVDLTIPTEVKHETGVMNAKGTLLFAQSTSGNLSENDWKQLFNSLDFIQPN